MTGEEKHEEERCIEEKWIAEEKDGKETKQHVTSHAIAW